MSYPITLPACKLLGPASPCTAISAARLPPNSPRNATFALLADHRGMLVTRPANTRLVARIFTSDAYYRSRPANPPICGETPSDSVAARLEDTVLTERRRLCVRAAPILQYCGAVMRSKRPCVVGAVQVAPIPRIRPREVERYGGSEAHGASKPRPFRGRILVWACFVRKNVLAKSGIFGW